jgi:hypothetical protein
LTPAAGCGRTAVPTRSVAPSRAFLTWPRGPHLPETTSPGRAFRSGVPGGCVCSRPSRRRSDRTWASCRTGGMSQLTPAAGCGRTAARRAGADATPRTMSDRWVNWLLRPGGHATGTLGPRPRALARPRHRPASTGSGASTHSAAPGSWRGVARSARAVIGPGTTSVKTEEPVEGARGHGCPGTPSYPPPTPRRCRVG